MGRQLLAYSSPLLLLGILACTDKVDVYPDAAVPGETVQLRNKAANFQDLQAVNVEFDGVKAGVVRIVDSTAVEVLVPNLVSGGATVSVEYLRFEGEGEVKILPPSKQRLFFQILEGEIRAVMTQPYTGHYDDMVVRGRRLSYDVLDSQGRVVHTGAIRYPEGGTGEAFPGNGQIHRIANRGPISFGVKAPRIKGDVQVLFYDVGDGVDLKSFQDRANRNLIADITIPSP